MKVILVMVMSVDGKTTKWGDSKIHGWTSKEDHQFFFALLKRERLLIMGRKTYQAARLKMKLSPHTPFGLYER